MNTNKKTFKTLELAVEFYQVTEALKLKGHLRDQLLRASSSIPLNLTEGNAKWSVKEKKRFYQIAYGSLKECQMLFRLLNVKDENLIQRADHLGASLFKLMRSDIKQL